MKIYTVFPRGFCAGVFRAVSMLDEVISKFGTPIYVNHEIIHNTFIVKYFEKKGVIFEHDLEKIPAGSIVVLSAHGVGPSFYKKLTENNLKYIDATCPLVLKVHTEALKFISEGYHILYIGKHDHQEALGVQDFAPDKITIISDYREADAYFSAKISDKIALLTQTTLSVDETKDLISYIQEKFPSIVLPKAGDICYATTNRQAAIKKLCDFVDTVFIIGSKSSSNSNKLKHLAEKMGKKAFLIDGVSDIELTMLSGGEKIGISAGASGPEEIVQKVVEFLKRQGGEFIQEVKVIEEKVSFPYVLELKN